METLWAGIDIGKASFVAATVAMEEEREVGEIANDTSGYAELATQLEKVRCDQDCVQIHMVVEPTGGYELALVAFAHE